jgi:hypothetical protein
MEGVKVKIRETSQNSLGGGRHHRTLLFLGWKGVRRQLDWKKMGHVNSKSMKRNRNER